MTYVQETLQELVRLERDLESRGWDLDVGAWTLHNAGHDGETVELVKLGGEGFIDLHPLALLHGLRHGQRMDPCQIGMALMFECYLSANADYDQAREDPNRKEVRYVMGAMRGGTVIIVTRERGCAKSRASIVPTGRHIGEPNAASIAESMRATVAHLGGSGDPLLDLLSALPGKVVVIDIPPRSDS